MKSDTLRFRMTVCYACTSDADVALMTEQRESVHVRRLCRIEPCKPVTGSRYYLHISYISTLLTIINVILSCLC